jgi:hypothetical protein
MYNLYDKVLINVSTKFGQFPVEFIVVHMIPHMSFREGSERNKYVLLAQDRIVIGTLSSNKKSWNLSEPIDLLDICISEEPQENITEKAKKESNKHKTEIPLFIRANDIGPGKGFEFVEIPIGTEVEFIKYGDECKIYSSDPVKANCYSVESMGIDCKFLYTEKGNVWSFYNIK